MNNEELFLENQLDQQSYDYLFIGLGASNSLILMSLLKHGLAVNKKIVILEPSGKAENDKTYCFWAPPSDQLIEDLSDIIGHRYTALSVNETHVQNIDEYPYYYIKSLDLYNHVRQLISAHSIPIYNNYVTEITSSVNSQLVQTSSSTYKTNYIFDSRPPVLANLNATDIYLHQSFYGLHVRLEEAVFDPTTFEMMNFNIDQAGFTQFTYTLPLNSREALIELTRFGSEKINLDYAKKIISKYVTDTYGSFDIVEEEIGCIPMTTYMTPSNPNPQIIHTGTRANLIKPSTGYGFKNMYLFAEQISETIKEINFIKLSKIAVGNRGRFRFYDALLLIILFKWPEKGKTIFSALFKSQSIHTIFSFLDEKSSLKQEIKIFASLPIRPFLKALFLYLKQQNILRYIVLPILVLVYLALEQTSPSIAFYFGVIFSILGLFMVGIPHGAVDYFVQKKRKNTPFLRFLTTYIIIIISYFFAWLYFPITLLIFFIIYSSFHFGESEIEQTGQSINSIEDYIKSFLFGLSILLFITLTHVADTLEIISVLIDEQIPSTMYEMVNNYAGSIVQLSFAYLLITAIKKQKRNHFFLLLLLAVSSTLPLLFAFSVYFIGQHSMNAWGHLKQKLSSDSGQLIIKALPYTLGAFLFLSAIISNSFFEYVNLKTLTADFFIFIACVSLPHILVMHLFYSKKY